jgi:hypothetical protein
MYTSAWRGSVKMGVKKGRVVKEVEEHNRVCKLGNGCVDLYLSVSKVSCFRDVVTNPVMYLSNSSHIHFYSIVAFAVVGSLIVLIIFVPQALRWTLTLDKATATRCCATSTTASDILPPLRACCFLDRSW